MPSDDLLSTIREQIRARLEELRPLVSEYEQLLQAKEALGGEPREPLTEDRPALHGTGPPKRASAARARGPAQPATTQHERHRPARGSAISARGPARPRRGSTSTAILAALEHGSHTTGELAVVSGHSGAGIRSNVRGLLTEGAIRRVRRDGRTAYALAR